MAGIFEYEYFSFFFSKAEVHELFYKLMVYRALRLDIYLNKLEDYVKSCIKYELTIPDFSAIFDNNKAVIIETELANTVNANTEQILNKLLSRHAKKYLAISCASLSVDEFKQNLSDSNYDYFVLKDTDFASDDLLQFIEDLFLRAKGE